MTEVDLAIIGGGPAGLATAIQGRMAGFSVRLFDRATPPIDKACGEGLMPDGVAVLDSLGVGTNALGRPFTGIRYLSGGLSASGRFPRGAGLGIRRTVLHTSMVARAEELGTMAHWGCAVHGIERQTVITDDGSFTAGWIIGADGLHSRVRQWLGVSVRHGRPRFGIRRHFEIEPWSDLVEVHWSDDCEAYVTPTDDGQVGVAILRGGGKERFDSMLACFPRLKERLANAPASSKTRGYGPLWSVPSEITRRHVALVGDAAGYLDAITGEGLSIAFQQSTALIRAIAGGSLSPYRKAVRELSKWPDMLIRALLFVERRPRMRQKLIRTLADQPELFSRLLAVHARQIRPRDLGLSNVGRLVRGLVISR